MSKETFTASMEIDEEVLGHILFTFSEQGMKVDGEGLNEAFIGSAFLSLGEKLVTQLSIKPEDVVKALADYLTNMPVEASEGETAE